MPDSLWAKCQSRSVAKPIATMVRIASCDLMRPHDNVRDVFDLTSRVSLCLYVNTFSYILGSINITNQHLALCAYGSRARCRACGPTSLRKQITLVEIEGQYNKEIKNTLISDYAVAERSISSAKSTENRSENHRSKNNRASEPEASWSCPIATRHFVLGVSAATSEGPLHQ